MVKFVMFFWLWIGGVFLLAEAKPTISAVWNQKANEEAYRKGPIFLKAAPPPTLEVNLSGSFDECISGQVYKQDGHTEFIIRNSVREPKDVSIRVICYYEPVGNDKSVDFNISNREAELLYRTLRLVYGKK